MVLREVVGGDLRIFFRHQLDVEANRMAAFSAENPADETAFMDRWRTMLQNESSVQRTIVWKGEVAGYVLFFELFGKPSVAYWIERTLWGQGIATRALMGFLPQIPVRPLYAWVAKDNIASRRVLEKCGFSVCGEGRSFANARRSEVAEVIFQLPGP
jgi:RimJ/RimL family protein N-acetyltransferase